MRNKITRTFVFNVYDTMVVDKENNTVTHVDVKLPKKSRSDARLQADIKAVLARVNENYRFVSVEGVSETSETRAMDEQLFILNSEIVTGEEVDE